MCDNVSNFEDLLILIVFFADFFNWNRVKLRYCDGASFSGDGQNQAAQLQFRGERIWRAAIADLKAKGMRYANQVLTLSLLSGSKARAVFILFL